METRQKLIERVMKELENLPYLLAKSVAGDREEDVKEGYEDALDKVAVAINHLATQAKENDWDTKSTYSFALEDLKKQLGFKGSFRELLTDETRSAPSTPNETRANPDPLQK